MSNAFRFLIAIGLILATSGANAQLFRAYLSINGNDANACTLPAPCRLLPMALSAVAPNGDIWILDSSNYNGGTVTIDKSVTILAVPGAVGSVVSVGNGAAALSVATPGLTVLLRNLSIVALAGAPGTTTGLAVAANSKVILEESLVSGFSSNGLSVSSGSLMVSKSTLANNSVALFTSGDGDAMLSGSRILANVTGTFSNAGAGLNSTITIDDCVFSSNSTAVRTFSTTGTALIFLNRSLIEGSTSAALSAASITPSAIAQIVINGNSIQRNPGSGWSITTTSGGTSVIISAGGNNFLTNGASTGAIQPASSLPAGSII